MYNQITDVVIAAAGLLLLGVALVCRGRLSGQRVIDLTAGGVALKADAFGLAVLVGACLIGSGLFFRYEQYEEKLKKLDGDNKGMQQALGVFRVYDLRLSLIFPGDDHPSPGAGNVLTAFVQKRGEPAATPYHAVRFSTELGGIVADFERLGYGDKLYIQIEDAQRSKKWRSDEVITPAAHLRMYPTK